jgi:hypothetical protein
MIRTNMLIGLFLDTILQLPIALKDSRLGTILTFRFLTGLFASAPVTNSGGVVADMCVYWRLSVACTWIQNSPHSCLSSSVQLGRGSSAWCYCFVYGLGLPRSSDWTRYICFKPLICLQQQFYDLIDWYNKLLSVLVVSSFIVESSLGYRWIFWVLLIASAATWLGSLFLLPETYSPLLLSQKAKKLRKETGDPRYYSSHEKSDYSIKAIVRRTILRPFEMMFTEVSFLPSHPAQMKLLMSWAVLKLAYSSVCNSLPGFGIRFAIWTLRSNSLSFFILWLLNRDWT